MCVRSRVLVPLFRCDSVSGWLVRLGSRLAAFCPRSGEAGPVAESSCVCAFCFCVCRCACPCVFLGSLSLSLAVFASLCEPVSGVLCVLGVVGAVSGGVFLSVAFSRRFSVALCASQGAGGPSVFWCVWGVVSPPVWGPVSALFGVPLLW